MFLHVFSPSYGTNQVLTATASSQVVNLRPQDDQVRIVNSGASKCYVRAYFSGTVPAPAATTADFAIPAGLAATITVGQVNDRLAYISAGGTTLDVMTGSGF